jgi:hypothetical protein
VDVQVGKGDGHFLSQERHCRRRESTVESQNTGGGLAG